MKNRILFIAILVALLIGVFFYQPLLFPKKAYPEIEDRLPDAPIIGHINVIDLTDHVVPLLFKQKVAYRDLISTDFILTQAKSGGINIQKPTYFYVTDKEDVGLLFSVSDSSKIPTAIEKLSAFVDVHDTIIGTQTAYKINQYNVYIYAERDWLFVYKGNNFLKHLFQIKYADNTSRRKRWQNFLEDEHFKNQVGAISYRTKATAKKGLNYIGATFTLDSTNIYIKTFIQDKDKFPFKLKSKGEGIPIDKEKSKYYADLHIQIDEKQKLEETYLYDLIQPFAKQINFPLKEFIAGWGGDLSLDIDRKVMVKESYIDTEFDDDFEAVDVQKNRWVERKQFSFFASSKESYFRTFTNQLFGRGFLRKEGDTHYFLAIPFINIVQKENSLSLYTGYYPKTEEVSATNTAVFIYDNTVFKFKIDTITTNELHMNATIPFSYVAKKFNIQKK